MFWKKISPPRCIQSSTALTRSADHLQGQTTGGIFLIGLDIAVTPKLLWSRTPKSILATSVPKTNIPTPSSESALRDFFFPVGVFKKEQPSTVTPVK